jgi:3-isopropylmalate/(R)-2-methylmalate dehydratase small subunit
MTEGGATGSRGTGSGGRAWVFGDDIDTDVLAPGRYMRGPVEELARHCLESVDPDFAAGVEAGDFVVARANFGIGSSREQAAQVLRLLGVTAVIAKSFGGIFYRNAFNLGLPAVLCSQANRIRAQDRLVLDAEKGSARNLTTGETYTCEPVPSHLLALIRDGGLIPQLERRLRSETGKEAP